MIAHNGMVSTVSLSSVDGNLLTQTEDRVTSLIAYHLSSVPPLKIKGKAIPLQAWTGPEGSKSLMLPDFKPVGT
jgi:hypothetical protein